MAKTLSNNLAALLADENAAKREIKNMVYLQFNSHIPDEQAEGVLAAYKEYIQIEPVSLFLFVYAYYSLGSLQS